MAKRTNVVILGAAGRDFHNFNTLYRDNPKYNVVCFTATQIPNIDNRKYPAQLAGELYPDGIPILPEDDLAEIIREKDVDLVVFSYSDVSHDYVMKRASIALSAGADFQLVSPSSTMLKSRKPVVAVCAVRTGCGKSQTTRAICSILSDLGQKVVAVRHPMPYGDLVAQKVQRFADFSDFDKYNCTIEEREEYEPHIRNNTIVYAGVDYGAILNEAESEADVIVWDGGNNDTSFYVPDIYITVVDPHRPGHETTYYPGFVNLLMADIIIINKVDTASEENIAKVKDEVRKYNKNATILEASSPITVTDPSLIENKRVLVVEDGPTLTHGEMKYGAGVIASRKYHAKKIVDPRPYTVDSIKETYIKYPGIGTLLPAMGYGEQQIRDLETTINRTDCDSVVIATPIDLGKLININKPHTRVFYEMDEETKKKLSTILKDRIGG